MKNENSEQESKLGATKEEQLVCLFNKLIVLNIET